jgi:hypothetical protein
MNVAQVPPGPQRGRAGLPRDAGDGALGPVESYRHARPGRRRDPVTYPVARPTALVAPRLPAEGGVTSPQEALL